MLASCAVSLLVGALPLPAEGSPPAEPPIAGTIITVAGNGATGFGGDGAPATSARLARPSAAAVGSSGALFVADTANDRVRRVDASGAISTVAGSGVRGFGGDGGPATAAALQGPSGVAVDVSGNLFIADTGNQRVRRVDASGVITTVAGTGIEGSGGDGQPATSAELRFPRGLAISGSGPLLIADTANHRVRQVDANGVITTVAGTGVAGLQGDGGPASSARLSEPSGVATDEVGTLYIADTGNNRVRRVDIGGTVATFAGGGAAAESGGAAVAASLSRPEGVAVSRSGAVFIADTGNHEVRAVDAAGNLSTLAGMGSAGFAGDGGPAAAARLSAPAAVAVDGLGTVVVTDAGNSRIREVLSAAHGRPVITAVTPAAGPVSGGTDVTIRGSGFSPRTGDTSVKVTTLVTFGPVAGALVSVVDDTTVRVRTPAHGLGRVQVSVTVTSRAPDGLTVAATSAPAADQFTFGPVMTPSVGPRRGGTEVTITGSGFDAGIRTVLFGALPAPFVRRESNTTLTAVSPADPGAADPVEVTITTSTGVRSTALGRFTYDDGSWSPTAGVPAAGNRDAATATLLASGAALVTGGFGRAALASAELYDPATSSWRSCSAATASAQCPGPMGEVRGGHTATLLPGGRVLVVGGQMVRDPATPVASAEIYDPATGRWSPGSPMTVARTGHTATTLAGGDVLVAGGRGSSGPLRTAEVYAPSTGRWTAVPSVMATARASHTATLLSDPDCEASRTCKVLVSGGSTGDADSAELYDPVSQAWTSSPMVFPRTGHTATLLPGGKVLVAGGEHESPADADGMHDRSNGIGMSAEVYDPVTNRWTRAGDMSGARARHTATLLADAACGRCSKVLVVGGSGPKNGSGIAAATSSAELFDPQTGSWSPTGAMGLRREGHVAVRLEGPACQSAAAPGYCGRVLAAGGLQDADAESITELFDPQGPPAAGRVGTMTPPVGPSTGGTAVTFGGSGLLDVVSVRFGGLEAVTRYRSDRRLTVIAPAHPPGRADVTLTTRAKASISPAEGFTYANGGWAPTAPESPCPGEAVCPAPPQALQPAPTRYLHTATTLDGPACRSPVPPGYCGKVLVAGGTEVFQATDLSRSDNGRTASAALYDPASQRWTATGSLDSCATASPSCRGRSNHTATLLDGPACHAAAPPAYCGKVLVVGGVESAPAAPGGGGPAVGGGPGATATAEIFDPATGAWSPTGPLLEPRMFHTATLLSGPGCAQSCDRVLVAGGATSSLIGISRSTQLYDPSLGSWVEGPASGAELRQPSAVAVDGAGGVIIADTAHNRVRSIDRAGILTTLAGDGTPGFGGDGGDARFARLDRPAAVAVDRAGNLFIADSLNHRIRRIDTAGIITTVVGDGTPGFSGDGGRAASATLREPSGLAVDRSGNVLIADTLNHRIRRVDTSGTITTTVGSGAPDLGRGDFAGDGGPATSSRLNQPMGVAVDAGGNVLIADSVNHRIRKVDRTGVITTMAGSGPVGDGRGGFAGDDGPAIASQLNGPAGVAVDSSGNVFVADSRNDRVRKVELNGTITTLTGEERGGGAQSPLTGPRGVAVDSGRVLIADTGGNRIRSIGDGTISTIAGRSPSDPVAGSLTTARALHSATLLASGEVLVAGGAGATATPGDTTVLDSAELYSPATGQWSLTGRLAVPRFSHTATPLNQGRCATACGRVVVVGGVVSVSNSREGGEVGFLASTEVYDRPSGSWSPGPVLNDARAGHTATVLPSGKLLVAGGGMTIEVSGYTYSALASAELFDPEHPGAWMPTSALRSARGLHTTTLLDGPSCRGSTPLPFCGTVLAVGGAAPGAGPRSGDAPPALGTSELFVEPPELASLTPSLGPAGQTTSITVTGTGLQHAASVSFDDQPAASFRRESPDRLTVVAPPHPKGAVAVVVSNGDGARSAGVGDAPPERFTYVDQAGLVSDLSATAISPSDVALRFSASDDGTGAAPATRYVVKQASGPLDSAAEFDAADTLCASCTFAPALHLSLSVGSLSPGATYRFAVRALNRLGQAGPISNVATVATPLAQPSRCRPACGPPAANGRPAGSSGQAPPILPGGAQAAPGRALSPTPPSSGSPAPAWPVVINRRPVRAAPDAAASGGATAGRGLGMSTWVVAGMTAGMVAIGACTGLRLSRRRPRHASAAPS